MSMGVVSDDEFSRQLNNVTNPVPTPVVLPVIPEINPITPIDDDVSIQDTDVTERVDAELVSETDNAAIETIHTRGRKLGDNNVPPGLRQLIAGEYATKGRKAAIALAREFGISASSVSAYANGTHGTAQYNGTKDKGILEFVKQRKDRVTKKALKVMTASLDKITEDKLALTDAKDLSVIAKNMASIVGDMQGDGADGAQFNGVNFVVYAPPVASEESYGSINSNE